MAQRSPVHEPPQSVTRAPQDRPEKTKGRTGPARPGGSPAANRPTPRAAHLLQSGGNGPRPALAFALGLGGGCATGNTEHVCHLRRPRPALPHGGGTARADGQLTSLSPAGEASNPTPSPAALSSRAEPPGGAAPRWSQPPVSLDPRLRRVRVLVPVPSRPQSRPCPRPRPVLVLSPVSRVSPRCPAGPRPCDCCPPSYPRGAKAVPDGPRHAKFKKK